MEKKLLFAASTGDHICKFHLPYLRQFRADGWVVHAACAGHVSEADMGVDVPFTKRMFSPVNLRAMWILRKRIRKERYAAVIVHTSLAAFFTRLAVLGLKDRPKVINMVHGYLFDDGTPPVKRSLLLAAEKLTAPVTDLLITMNRCDYEIAQKHRLGSTVAAVCGVGVDFLRLDEGRTGCPAKLRRRLGVKNDDFVLIYPAEFSERKMQHILLRAMTRLPENVVLVLPGAGQCLETCKKLAQELGVTNRVRFPGYAADIAAWYEMADAAVSASRSEGLPFNVMEAMYFGLPVVASAVKGHVDLIQEERFGLLYPCGDPIACAGQIMRLIKEPELARSISQAAMQRIRQYGLDKIQPRVMELYYSVINE